MQLTHFDTRGQARMVEVGEKEETRREAVAQGEVVMQPSTLELIAAGGHKKGDVLGVARVAAIMAAKNTAALIPMAHPIMITGVDVEFTIAPPDRVLIQASVRCTGRTGVEMEALTAVSAAALTIYDMCKAVDRGMVLGNIRLLRKSGGKSGTFVRD